MATSSWTGQRALQPLPSKSLSNKRRIDTYSLPEELVQDRTTFRQRDDVGFPVLKLGKNGKLQPRRLAFSPDRRTILVSTHRIRSWRGLWQRATGRDTSVKIIPLLAVDRIQRGPNSRRFLAAEEAVFAALHGPVEVYSQALDHDKGVTLSIIFQSAAVETGTQASASSAATGSSNNNNSLSSSTIANGAASSSSSQPYSALETLDLVIPDVKAYEILITALEDLVALCHEEKQRYSRTLQFLHFGWCEMNKEWEAPMTLPEWALLCDRLQVPLKRPLLQHLFKEECDDLATMGDEGALHTSLNSSASCILPGSAERLSLPAVALLVEKVKRESVPVEKDPLEQLWREIVRTDPVPQLLEATVDNRAASPSRVTTPRGGRPDPAGICPNDDDEDDEEADAGDDDASLELSICQDGREESVSAVALLSFVRSQQKQYATSLEDVHLLVETLNQQMTPEDYSDRSQLGPGKPSRKRGGRERSMYLDDVGPKERLTKSRFLAYLASDANDILDPAKTRVGADDMSQPLSHYWIHASHDTYLATQASSFAGKSAFLKYKQGSPDAYDGYMYTAALLRGVRCLEIDLWDSWGAGPEPVIARQAPTSAERGISLVVALRAIRHFLEQDPYCFPILIYLENHCSYPAQVKAAKLLYEILGSTRMIFTPNPDQELKDEVLLPSPESARGKVIIVGKRPLRVKEGCRVVHDDYDESNDIWEDAGKVPLPPSSTTPRSQQLPTSRQPLNTEEGDEDEDDPDEVAGVIVGFDEKGAVRSTAPRTVQRSPQELVALAAREVDVLQSELDATVKKLNKIRAEVEEEEQLAAQLTQQAGLSPSEVRRRAARAANRQLDDEDLGREIYLGEEKSNKDEGIEVHEILTDFVEGGRDIYARSAQEAMEASHRTSIALSRLRELEGVLAKAHRDLQDSRLFEEQAKENARRSAAEAIMYREHAESAKERVEKVKELLRNTQESASSAGTVVQTATTEAKISEKRASDAEARAARALAVAEKDRKRADEETRKEEELEQEVSDLHTEFTEAGEAAKAARERVEKAELILDRVKEQIKLIENSSQYRKEMQTHDSGSVNGESSPRHGGSFAAKLAAKIQEKETCQLLIKEAQDSVSIADLRRNELQRRFEDKAHLWKMQSDLASQMRKAADRSSHLAEELAEHAEEEREAANLRQIAMEKAEATVQNRGSQRGSLETQLVEAERAASEAAAVANESRKRAEHYAREADKAKDHDRHIQLVERSEGEWKQAKAAYDAAMSDKERKEKRMLEEKRRLDTAADVYKTAVRDAAFETDRIRVEELYQQEAIVSFNKAVMLRKEIKVLESKAALTATKTEAKRIALRKARLYEAKANLSTELPVALARLTLLHTTKFRDWGYSLSLSNSHVHSIAQNVLLQMMQADPNHGRSNLERFTKGHLVRVFTPWRDIRTKAFSNYDPVLAWSLGCQIVPMNLHSADENLLVADGRFRQNGSCGYVLKPQELRENIAQVSMRQAWWFSVLAAFNLPKISRRTVNPFVKISLYAGSNKETRVVYRTKPAGQNGLNPVWDDSESFSFSVKHPNIAVVTFSVWDKVDDKTEEFIAGSALPVSCLREGYRSIALFDAHHARSGPFAFASLVVKASKR